MPFRRRFFRDMYQKSLLTELGEPWGTSRLSLVAAAIVICAIFIIYKSSRRQLKVATISGSVWLTKNDGSSHLMRGVHIYLLQAKVGSGAIDRALSTTAKDLAYERSQTPPAISDLADRQEALRKFEADPYSNVSVDNVYMKLKATGPYDVPNCSSIVIETTVKHVDADVDGRYVITSVPSGRYFLYSSFYSDVILVEWLVPVMVTGGAVKLDMNNNNVSLMINIPENSGSVQGNFAAIRASISRDYRDKMRVNVVRREASLIWENIK